MIAMQPDGNPNYDFIFGNNPSSKGPLGNKSKQERILIVAAGVIGLLALFAIFMGILSAGNDKTGQNLVAVAQQQTEIIRITTIGVSKSRSANTQNLAITAKATLESDYATVTELLNKSKIKTDAKILGAAKNPQTDTLLTQADQTNQFDTVFVKQLSSQIAAYQVALKKAYDESSSTSTKEALSMLYEHTETLIPPAAKPATE